MYADNPYIHIVLNPEVQGFILNLAEGSAAAAAMLLREQLLPGFRFANEPVV